MYDARERAIQDRQWELYATAQVVQGQLEERIETIHILQGLLNVPLGDEQELHTMTLKQLRAMTSDLQEQARQPDALIVALSFRRPGRRCRCKPAMKS